MSKLGKFRTANYTVARRIGDYQAIASGSPTKIAKRVIRKKAGRTYGSLLRRIVK